MGIGDFVTGIFGSKNEEHVDPYKTDANSYEYGGHAGGAAAAAGEQGQRSQTYANQQGLSYNTGNNYLEQGQGARIGQQSVADMMLARARGDVPSIAQQQGQLASNQLVQQQASAAASARGPAALALAQQNAANNTSTGQATIGAQTAVAAAQERLAAEQAASGAYGNMRAGDLGAAQTSFGASSAAGQLSLGASGLQNNINQSQLNAQQNKEAQNSANYNAAHGINAQVSGQNAATNQQNAMGFIGQAASTAGGIATASDARAKYNIHPMSIAHRAGGGPVQAGQPYVVGERGPEVVVPQQSGTVVPNHALSTWGNTTPEQQAEWDRNAAWQAQTNELLGQKYGGAAAEAQMKRDAAIIEADRNMRARGIAQTTDADIKPGAREADGSAVLSDERRVQMARANLAQTQRQRGEAPQSTEEKVGIAASKEEAKPADKPKGEEKKKFGVGDVLTGFGKRATDIAESGAPKFGSMGGAYSAPQLLGTPAYVPTSYSSEETKLPIAIGGAAPMGGSGVFDPTGTTKLSPGGGGMDVMGSLKANADFGTKFMKSPMSYSSEETKEPLPLSEPKGQQLHVSDSGKGFYSSEPQPMTASLSGPAPQYSSGGGEKSKDAPMSLKSAMSMRKPSTDEASRWADAELAKTHAQTAALQPRMSDEEAAKLSAEVDQHMAKMRAGLASGPSVSGDYGFSTSDERAKKVLSSEAPMAAANRSQEGYAYAYKPEFAQAEGQKPGEANVGPIAQNMAANPVARTAVKQSDDGLLQLDLSKLSKLHSAGIASLQDQVDALHEALAKKLGGRRG